MKMQDVLFEPAPQLFNGIEPGSIGWQTDQLDRQSVVNGFGAGFLGPMPRQLGRPWPLLLLERRKHIGMEVDRSVV